jgi:single-strand DNA-binding protein
MGSLNKVTLIGNVGRDVEVKAFDNGGRIAKFPLATTESYKTKSGEKVENTTWHNIVIRAEGLSKIAEMYVGKGSQVAIEGKLYVREYQNKEGIKAKITEIVVDQFGGQLILLSKKDPQPQQSPQTLGDYDQMIPTGI